VWQQVSRLAFAVLIAFQLFLGLALVRAEFGLWSWRKMTTSEIESSPDALAFISQLTWQSGSFLVLTLAGLAIGVWVVARERRILSDAPKMIGALRWLSLVLPLLALTVAGSLRTLAH
jgi:hypothetical protein